MRTKFLLAAPILALASANAFAVPPTPKVEVLNTVDAQVVNTVDAQVVNVIPLESLRSLGTWAGFGGVGSGWSLTFISVPPGWLHSVNFSVASAGDSYCLATLQLIITTDGSEEITKIGSIVSQNGNNAISNDFSSPIQIDFDDSISDFSIQIEGSNGDSAAGESCYVSLGGVYEVSPEALAEASSMKAIQVVKEQSPL